MEYDHENNRVCKIEGGTEHVRVVQVERTDDKREVAEADEEENRHGIQNAH